jgi:D-arabinose 1-dehydrogenase-like Zn-dependent alcohol dehydrogenase
MLTLPPDAEYCTLRTEATVRIPHDADPAEYAPLLCAGVTVFNGIRKMNIVPGDTVAIQGLGGLGHLAVQYARKLGYRTVALSTSADKKDFAHQLGATDYIDTNKEDAAQALQKMGGASLIVVTAPNPEVMGPLVAGLGPLGKLLILARELMAVLFTLSALLTKDSCWRSTHQHRSADHEGRFSPWMAKWSCSGQRRSDRFCRKTGRQVHD